MKRRDVLKGMWPFGVAAFSVLFGVGSALLAAGSPGGPAERDMAKLHRLTVERQRDLCDSSAALKVKPALIPLPPGAVKPAGWLRDWAEAAAEGITGELDERDEVFRSAWKGEGRGWPLEQCGYWLDGLVRLAYILDDPELIAKARTRLDPVVDGALAGGPSFIHWASKEPADFDNWAHSHMGRALVAYYQATGDPRVLDALVKVYRDLPLPQLGNRFWPVNGISNLDPMLETYVLSGDEGVLRNALAVNETDAFQKTVEEWNGGQFGGRQHAVIVYENIRVPSLLYPFTGDATRLEATRSAIRWLDRDHLLPYGVTSGGEDLAGIGSEKATEACDVAVSAWTFLALRTTGDRQWSDRIERVFFNAAPGVVARDFQSHCYYQSPNRINNEFPGRVPSPGGDFSYKPVNGTRCCAGNLNRMLPNYIMHMWMATPDGGLAWTLYGPCRVESVAGGVGVRLESTGAYPFEETVTLSVSPERPARFAVCFRLPDWCKNPSVDFKAAVNGEAFEIDEAGSGFARVERTWSDGDAVTLRFPMQPRVEGGRETAGAPYASVFYGPLLMALPIPDEGPNKPDQAARWQYAFDLGSPAEVSGLKVVRRPMPHHWDWPLDSPLAIEMPAALSDWEFVRSGSSLPLAPVKSDGSATIRLIPYGCTLYRMSMLPITPRAAWVVEAGER